MRIALDGTPFLIEKTGIGHYTANLIEALHALQPDLDLVAFTVSLRAAHRLKSQVQELPVEPRGFNLPANLLYYRIWPHLSVLPAERLLGTFDVFHATNYQAPALKRAALVMTIHDLNFVRFPEMQSKGIRRFMHTLPGLAEKAAAILVDSEFTAAEVADILHIGPEKVHVVYPGLDEKFRRPASDEIERALDCYRLTQPYVAYVGNMHPRKNLYTLIEAYSQLHRQGLEHRLAVIGGGGLGALNNREYLKLKEMVAQAGLEEVVTFTGYVPDKWLPALLSGSDALVLPSLYEGFGLPPLEAMACGVPVLVSRRASLPEVVGEAGRYVEDPLDAAEIAMALGDLLSDRAAQESMRERGMTQARRFDWTDTARRTLDIYREVTGAACA